MAEENRVCVVDRSTASDGSTAARLLSELTNSSVESSADSVKWNISNRYYEAEVTLEVKGDLDEEKGAWQGLITLCNLNELSSLKKAYSVWEELESETTPPVNLLVGVVEGCGLSEGVRSEVVQWCLKKGVELVEWNLDPPQNSQEEEEDFPESVGVARVSEALQAHMWPEMCLKNRRRDRTLSGGDDPGCNGEKGGTEAASSTERNERTSSSTATTIKEDSVESSKATATIEEESKAKESSTATGGGGTTCSQSSLSADGLTASGDVSSEARLEALLGVGDMEILERGGGGGRENDVEDFETLFAKFADMKAHAQSLPHEERKAYAEKVVMSFWKAIGGDEEEVCNDSDSEQ